MESSKYEYFGYLVKRVQQELRIVMDTTLNQYHLTTAQYATLTALERKNTVSNAELARTCFVTPQTMIRIIANLEEVDFVSRRGSASNDRVIEIELTEKGRKALAKAHQATQKLEAQMIYGLSKNDLSTVRQGLVKFLENLERVE